MTPVHTKATTRVLGAPAGWDAERDGPCDGLPAVDSEVYGGSAMVFPYWRPTWRERVAVLLGRPVRVCVVGRAHPPVSLDVGRD